MSIDDQGRLSLKCRVYIPDKLKERCMIKDILSCPIHLINPRVCDGICRVSWTNIDEINILKSKGFKEL